MSNNDNTSEEINLNNIYQSISGRVYTASQDDSVSEEKFTAEDIATLLAEWSKKYPRGGIYSMNSKMDEQLIEIEEKAKKWHSSKSDKPQVEDVKCWQDLIYKELPTAIQSPSVKALFIWMENKGLEIKPQVENKKVSSNVIELLERLEDYMENIADSVDTDTGIAPNREMGFLVEIRDALSMKLVYNPKQQ